MEKHQREKALLESPSAIRKELGKEIMELIDAFSLHQARRRGTAREKRRLLRIYGNPRCASCGRLATSRARCSAPTENQAAHILALSEGGDTDDGNLVLLCAHGSHRREKCDACLRGSWCGDKGCHLLFDEGYASVSEVRALAENWRRGKSVGFRETLLERSREMYSQNAPLNAPGAFGDFHKYVYQKAYWKKAIGELRRARKDGLSKLDHAQSYLHEASTERRRGKQRSLDRSLKILGRFERGHLPPEKVASYLYELGYVQQLQGLHAQSLSTYERVLKLAAADSGPDSFPAVSARNRVMAVKTILLKPRAVTARGFAQVLREFETLVKRAERLKPPVRSGNWMFNVLGWRTRYAIKCGRIGDARESFRRLRELRDSQHAGTGYSRTSSTTVLRLDAMVLAMTRGSQDRVHDQVRRAATVVRSCLRGHHRPEGIRDDLLTLERGWKRLREGAAFPYRERAEVVAGVRRRILDGSSFLDPYRA